MGWLRALHKNSHRQQHVCTNLICGAREQRCRMVTRCQMLHLHKEGSCKPLLQASNITMFRQQDIFGPSGPLALAVQAVVCEFLHLGLNSTFPGNSSGPDCSTIMANWKTKGPGMPGPKGP